MSDHPPTITTDAGTWSHVEGHWYSLTPGGLCFSRHWIEKSLEEQ